MDTTDKLLALEKNMGTLLSACAAGEEVFTDALVNAVHVKQTTNDSFFPKTWLDMDSYAVSTYNNYFCHNNQLIIS